MELPSKRKLSYKYPDPEDEPSSLSASLQEKVDKMHEKMDTIWWGFKADKHQLDVISSALDIKPPRDMKENQALFELFYNYMKSLPDSSKKLYDIKAMKEKYVTITLIAREFGQDITNIHSSEHRFLRKRLFELKALLYDLRMMVEDEKIKVRRTEHYVETDMCSALLQAIEEFFKKNEDRLMSYVLMLDYVTDEKSMLT